MIFSSRIFLSTVASVAALLGVACATATPFDRAIQAHQWSSAAQAFDTDSSLHMNEKALFQAAMLHSFPDRETYDPEQARALFEQLLKLYPQTSMRQEAVDHLALLYELQKVQNEAQTREHELETKIAQLAEDTVGLHARIDSIGVRLQAEEDQSALLRKVTGRLESDLQDRESQLRSLNAELAQLKEIDLKPGLRSRVGDSGEKKKVPVNQE